MPAQKINTVGFLSEFMRRHGKMQDRPFCWILGSGASVQSGIPTGGKLAMDWLKEMHEMEAPAGEPIEKWSTEKNLGIKGFDFKRAASFYPWIYWRRFRDFKEAGYAMLEDAMDDVEPSYGYSVLAKIMAGTQHKVAITTNFDNLAADALSIYTDAFPLVCGHESLTGFIRPNLRRPLIAKIHRDLLLSPKSEPDEIEKLPEEWESALRSIFENYTPIVIGYGGNDGSLMGFLKTLKPIKGGIFWCYRGPEAPEQVIHEVVEYHRGKLVPILGFDELMLQLWEKMGLSSPIPDLEKTHKQRVAEWQKQFEELSKRVKEPAKDKEAEAVLKPVREAAAAASERLTKEKSWWAWQLKADAEKDQSECEKIYRDGLEDFPKSAELTGNFALFMQDIREDYDEAERLYRRAMLLDPKDADYAGNFAVFMNDIRKDYGEAERLYRKALELNPKHVIHTCNFAVFMKDVHKDFDEAERLYRRALELDPKHAQNLGNFAVFMTDIRENQDEAERLYRRALELDPKNANNTGNFANFMSRIRKDYDAAERLYARALELDPKEAQIVGNFAVFMSDIRKSQDEAERLYRRALELDPKHILLARNFGNFMKNIRKDYDEAERLYRRALELDPQNPRTMNLLGWFLTTIRKHYDEAEPLLRKAHELAPDDGGICDSLAVLLHQGPKRYDEAEKLFRRAVELTQDNAEIFWNFATFMEQGRKNYSEADQLYEKALGLDPNNTEWQTYLAAFRLKHKGSKK